MLVLSRRVDEQIRIGDDITVTVVRLDGNRVRIGVNAPRDIRILRGELADVETTQDEPAFELSEREFAFAHQNAADKISRNRAIDRGTPQVFSGSVAADGTNVNLAPAPAAANKPAPLAGFVSAT